MLKVEDLEVSYGNIAAVQGISFEVREGETVALIGANGAGKTTTLRTISGLLRPRAGTILFHGESLANLKSDKIVLRGLIHVPEGRQIFSKMTIAENLRLGGYNVRDNAVFQKRKEMVYALFPILKERYRQSAGTLSGGEQQMLAIGRALMAGPRMLLLDEPSLGLAPILVQQVFQIIARLKKQGITILLVEQNASESLKISDRAYIMETGKIAMSGESRELIHDRRVQDAYLGGAV